MSEIPQRFTRRHFLQKSAALGLCTAGTLTSCSRHYAFKSAGTIVSAPVEVQYVETGFTRSYLLPCNSGYLLIDTSYPNEYENFISGLRHLNIDPNEIKYLLLSHHHDDHAGFAARLIEDTGATLIVHAKALPYLRQGQSEDISQPVNTCVRCLVGIFSQFHDFTFPPLNVSETDIIISGDDSEFLDDIGIEGVVLHTPGHTDDSISVVLKNGSAFVGDVAMNFMNYCGTRHRPIYITDINEVYTSWEKLIASGARRIYPAHGKPFDAQELVHQINRR